LISRDLYDIMKNILIRNYQIQENSEKINVAGGRYTQGSQKIIDRRIIQWNLNSIDLYHFRLFLNGYKFKNNLLDRNC